MTRDVKYGLVPNGYSGYDNRPLYNSVDASLLLFETVSKYLKYTGDYKFIKDSSYLPKKNWYHFPFEEYEDIKQNRSVIYMFRMYQARNLMIYTSILMIVWILIK